MCCYCVAILLLLQMLLAAACCCLLLLAAACCCLLLLFAIVCRMAKFVAGSLNLIPVFSLYSFRTRLMFNISLGSTAVSHLRPRFAYILSNYGHARSQGGCQPAASKPPLVYQYIVHIIPSYFAKKNMLARSMYVAYQVLFVKCIKVACMCEKLCFVFLCVKAMLPCTYTPVPGIPGSMYRYCILRLDVITHETGRDRTDFALFAAEKDQGGAGWNGHSGTVEVGGVYPSYNAGRSPTHMHHTTINT